MYTDSDVMPYVINLMAVLFVAFILFAIIFEVVVRIKVWRKNNNTAVLTTNVAVVNIRIIDNIHQLRNIHIYNRLGLIKYFVTFELENGESFEILVPYDDTRFINEGDAGRLTFQGTRYKGFERF